MALIESIIARAKANKQRIVLPESLEERTLTAADKCLADDIADIILIGNKEEIFADHRGGSQAGAEPTVFRMPHHQEW